MTATTATTAAPPSSGPSTSSRLQLVAELTLVAVTVVVVIGFGRLFDTDGHLAPLVLHAVTAHVVAAGLRRRRVALLPAAVLTAVAAVLAVAWLGYWSTTVLGLPTRATLDAVGADLDLAAATFADVTAPAPVEPGFLVILGLALWAAAWLADLAAFRLSTSIEALVPATALLCFTGLLGTDDGRVAGGALFAGAALAFVLAHRLSSRHDGGAWLANDDGPGTGALLRGGAVLVAVAVAVGVVAGPRLPGSAAEAVVDLDGEQSEGPRSIPSPYVEVRGRLVEQTDLELFRVRADARSYWRLTALEDFDGNQWTGQASYRGASGDLPGDDPPPGAVELRQTFEITALESIWLPAAYQARELVEVEGSDARWDDGTGTLIVPTDVPTSDGVTYEVVSALPTLDPDALRATEGGDERAEVVEPNLALPAVTSSPVRTLAAELTADAPTRYDAARALQDHLRSPQFTYSTSPPPSSGPDPVAGFLFETQEGFCQQFSAAFAAMARAVDIPTRIAVGFTAGVQDPDDPTAYSVTGRYAHAWPEVHFPGVGWVPFEPTPGRGIPGAEAYTGVPEAQDGVPVAPPATTPETGATDPTAPAPPSTAPGEAPATSAPADAPTTGPGDDGGVVGADEADDGPHPAVVGALLAVGAVVLVVAALALLGTLRERSRRRRLTGAVDGTVAARAAWAATVERLAVLDVGPRPHEAPTEFAARLRRHLPPAPDGRADLRRAVPALAQLVERADYGDRALGDDERDRSVALADEAAADLGRRTTTATRLAARLDPRSARRRVAARHHRRQPDAPTVGRGRITITTGSS